MTSIEIKEKQMIRHVIIYLKLKNTKSRIKSKKEITTEWWSIDNIKSTNRLGNNWI
jgi:hypothetical protein